MINPPHPPASPDRREPFGRESGPRLTDLAADLLWPRLFQVVALALKPERVGLAFFGLVAAMAIGSLAELGTGMQNSTLFVLETIASAFSSIAGGVFGLDSFRITLGIQGLLGLPGRVWDTYGWLSLPLLLPAILALAIAGCAICRMAACDFSQGVLMPWTDGLRFGLRKAGSLVTALFAPLILVGVIAAGIAIAGTIFAWPGVNLLGALLYGLFLVFSAIAVLVLVCWALGLPLLVPAIACEGTDGLDAIQRAYAYVLGRPLRLLAFAAVALLLCWVTVLIASLFAEATTGFAQWAATGLSGAEGVAITEGQPQDPPLEGLDAVAAHIVHFWVGIPAILVWAVALSLYFCASTVVYLLIRQICDGQDWGELWMPGMIEGTMAQAMQARAASPRAPEPASRLGEGGVAGPVAEGGDGGD
jgi:hypothetical protein